MNRIDRLFAITLVLQRKTRIRAQDLARMFEVSERTIYRDITALSESGVPVVALPGEGYELAEGYFLRPIVFTKGEFMNHGLTVELVIFNLNEGVEEAAFLHASDAIMADIRTVPGYLRRELLKGDDGLWIDVVHWRSREDALAAAELFNTLPSAQVFGSYLDTSSITMLHPTQAMVWNG